RHRRHSVDNDRRTKGDLRTLSSDFSGAWQDDCVCRITRKRSTDEAGESDALCTAHRCDVRSIEIRTEAGARCWGDVEGSVGWGGRLMDAVEPCAESIRE